MPFTSLTTREAIDARRSIGKRAQSRPLICTFHSLCVQILRRHIELLGFPKRFLILDRGDQESHARAALREVRFAEHRLAPGDLIGAIGRWKSRAITPQRALHDAISDFEQLCAVAYQRYAENLRQAGSLDFDDLLLFTEASVPRLTAKIQYLME